MKILKQLSFKANLTLYLNYTFLVYPSVTSDSLRPPRRYSPWNSPGQNTGMKSLSLLQGIFPTQGSNPGLPNRRWILHQLSHRKVQEYWSGQHFPSPGDLPDPAIEPGSPALQADSFPTELSGKPNYKFLVEFLAIKITLQKNIKLFNESERNSPKFK